MENYSKRIAITVLTLVLTIIALGTGVFAWFTMSTKASAGGLNGSAQAADGGFLISLGKDAPYVWEDDVDLAGAFTGEFKDITTTDGILMTKLDTTDADVNSFAEFTLSFLTGETNTEIFLIGLVINTALPTEWKSETELTAGDRTVTKGQTMSAKLSDAIRVSFLEEKEVKEELAFIFENHASEDNFVEGGVANFGNTLGFGTIEDNFAFLYYNKINSPNLTSITERTDKTLEATGFKIATTVSGFDHGVDDLDSSFNHKTSVTIRVWLEGWDQEAFNAIQKGEVTLSFEFESR